MKYLFLDLDGVLANGWSLKQPKSKWIVLQTPTVEDNIIYPFFPPSVEQINRVLKETGAEIILSSDWRIGYSLSQLDYIFKQNRVDKSPIAVTADLTQYWIDNELDLSGMSERDVEIEKYVQENNIKQFAIVDDRKLLVFPNNFVRTKYELSKSQADELIRILNQ